MAFDADPITLTGVKDGTHRRHASAEQPFEWAYLSMTAMAKYLDGVKSMIPPDRRIILPTRTIDRSNVELLDRVESRVVLHAHCARDQPMTADIGMSLRVASRAFVRSFVALRAPAAHQSFFVM